jgi:outer membrane protein assembly factor BamE (lipoprotein component of BamABCDE complex)
LHRVAFFVSAALVVGLVLGCSTKFTRMRYEKDLLRGMTKQEVEDTFGEPNSGKTSGVWKYVDVKRRYIITLRFDKNDRLFDKTWKNTLSDDSEPREDGSP